VLQYIVLLIIDVFLFQIGIKYLNIGSFKKEVVIKKVLIVVLMAVIHFKIAVVYPIKWNISKLKR
jgi:hypothetical protein